MCQNLLFPVLIYILHSFMVLICQIMLNDFLYYQSMSV